METDRETYRQTDRQTYRKTDRQVQTDRKGKWERGTIVVNNIWYSEEFLIYTFLLIYCIITFILVFQYYFRTGWKKELELTC